MELKFTDLAIELELDLPSKGSEDAAGWDLSACIDKPARIFPDEVVKIPTGIHIHIGSETFYGPLAGLLLPRSSNSGLILDNTIGLIDSDYQGEIMVKVRNISEDIITIRPKDRLAQLVIIPVLSQLGFDAVGEFSQSTARGSKGFGSSGGNYTHK